MGRVQSKQRRLPKAARTAVLVLDLRSMTSFFKTAAPCEAKIEHATNSANMETNWQLVMEVVDDLIAAPSTCEQATKALTKKLKDKNPNVQLLTVKVFEACWTNAGMPFRMSCCNKDTMNLITKLLLPSHDSPNPRVVTALKEMMSKWIDDAAPYRECSLITATARELGMAGVTLSPSSASGQSAGAGKGPTAAQIAAQEEEELQIAMAQSLSLDTAAASKLPSGGGSAGSDGAKRPDGMMAKALYDFEASEPNELSFKAGERVLVHDRSDPNWWSGETQSGAEGYFPHNFITFDLSTVVVPPVVAAAAAEPEPQPEKVVVRIDEEKLDLCLDMLYDIGAEGKTTDENAEKLVKLERECDAMQPLVEEQLRLIGRAEGELLALGSRFEKAMQLYVTLQQKGTGVQTARIAQPVAQMPSSLPEPPSIASPPQPVRGTVSPATLVAQKWAPPLGAVAWTPGQAPPLQSVSSPLPRPPQVQQQQIPPHQLQELQQADQYQPPSSRSQPLNQLEQPLQPLQPSQQSLEQLERQQEQSQSQPQQPAVNLSLEPPPGWLPGMPVPPLSGLPAQLPSGPAGPLSPAVPSSLPLPLPMPNGGPASAPAAGFQSPGQF